MTVCFAYRVIVTIFLILIVTDKPSKTQDAEAEGTELF